MNLEDDAAMTSVETFDIPRQDETKSEKTLGQEIFDEKDVCDIEGANFDMGALEKKEILLNENEDNLRDMCFLKFISTHSRTCKTDRQASHP